MLVFCRNNRRTKGAPLTKTSNSAAAEPELMRAVHRKHFFPFLCLLVAVAAAKEQRFAHTPKAGSPERRAICDAAREYIFRKYTTAPPPQPIVFKIEHLLVEEPYCNFEAIPLLEDGSYVSTEYMVDIAFNLCFKKTAGRWEVIVDLSRTDVPDKAELRTIKSNFPADFPVSLLSPTWRKLFGNAR
jgi:hypothetical protein